MRIVWSGENATHISGTLVSVAQNIADSRKRANALLPEIESVCRVPAIIGSYREALKQLQACEQLGENTARGMRRMIELFESAESDTLSRVRANATGQDSGELFGQSGGAVGAIVSGAAAAGQVGATVGGAVGARIASGAVEGGAVVGGTVVRVRIQVRTWLSDTGRCSATVSAGITVVQAALGILRGGAVQIGAIAVMTMSTSRTCASAALGRILK